MTDDLEETLAELGPDYRALVARLKASPSLEREHLPRRAPVHPPRILAWRPIPLLAAASLLAALAAVAVFAPRHAGEVPHALDIYTLAYGGPGAAGRLVQTQRPDGSWENDFVTCQNAAALRDVAEADVAYRKAVRYLRTKGLAPLSAAEFRRRGDEAAKRLRRG